jgi:hypothetical protein
LPWWIEDIITTKIPNESKLSWMKNFISIEVRLAYSASATDHKLSQKLHFYSKIPGCDAAKRKL